MQLYFGKQEEWGWFVLDLVVLLLLLFLLASSDYFLSYILPNMKSGQVSML